MELKLKTLYIISAQLKWNKVRLSEVSLIEAGYELRPVNENCFDLIKKGQTVARAFFENVRALAYLSGLSGVFKMSNLDNAVRIKTYFVCVQQRFDAVVLKDLIELGGLEISKSFARAILSKEQLGKYNRPVDNDILLAFLKGVTIEINSRPDKNLDFDEFAKTILGAVDSAGLMTFYSVAVA